MKTGIKAKDDIQKGARFQLSLGQSLLAALLILALTATNCDLFAAPKVTKKASDLPSAKLEVLPEPLHPGQAGLIRISFPEGSRAASLSVKASGLTIPVKAEKDGPFVGFVPVSLKRKPGIMELVVSWKSDEGGRLLRRKVRIAPKKYREEHLKVSRKMVEFSKKTLERVLADQKAVRNAAARATKAVYWSLPFVWPVDTVITSPFGLRRFFNGKPRSPHSGVDMRAREGQKVKSANRGIVTLIRDCYLSGNTVVVDHGGGVSTLYAHLSKVLVKEGQVVEKGQAIGLAGSTGRATGPHLHWGVSIQGIRVDPEQFMQVAGKPLTGKETITTQ